MHALQDRSPHADVSNRQVVAVVSICEYFQLKDVNGLGGFNCKLFADAMKVPQIRHCQPKEQALMR
jgi:hypothetical protein